MNNKNYILILFLFFINCGDEVAEIDKKQQKLVVNHTEISYQKYKKIINGIGKVDSENRAILSFEQPGQLNKIYARVGQELVQNNPIAGIDKTSYQAKYKIAKATLQKVELDFSNAKELLDSKTISISEYNQTKLLFENASANFILAQQALLKTDLVAPFDGTLIEMNLNIGELIIPSTIIKPPAIVADMENLIIKISLSEDQISKCNVGQVANIYIESIKQKITGHISEIALLPNGMSNSYNVNVSFKNIDKKVILGMVADVEILIDEISNAIVISRKLILEDESGYYVFLNKDGVANKQYVEFSSSYNGDVLIDSGINVGDQIIINGYRRLSDGALISSK
tara:strand:- start:175 stop:1200 length:1026 start_codon:yes stop_codon:yes gene_type:complete